MDEFIRRTAERTGYPPELVAGVVHDLWRTVHDYLTQPHLVRLGIRFAGLFRIDLNYAHLIRYVLKSERRGKTMPVIDYYRQVLTEMEKRYPDYRRWRTFYENKSAHEYR